MPVHRLVRAPWCRRTPRTLCTLCSSPLRLPFQSRLDDISRRRALDLSHEVLAILHLGHHALQREETPTGQDSQHLELMSGVLHSFIVAHIWL
mmetsp:Transcript_46207/g.122484  ORF Transcript_46207/g.122484 Transcript_46207/m.122484 type:complete len:93 (-) Transcript_46207:70-348(-)